MRTLQSSNTGETLAVVYMPTAGLCSSGVIFKTGVASCMRRALKFEALLTIASLTIIRSGATSGARVHADWCRFSGIKGEMGDAPDEKQTRFD